jgi:hypothetical protein
MPAHDIASVGCRQLCDELYRQLCLLIPNLKRAKTQNWCAIYTEGRNRFAYVEHRLHNARVDVWCAGDVDDLCRESRIEVRPRTQIQPGWEERFPARFSLFSEGNIPIACELLRSVSWPASIRRQRS